MLTDHYSLYVLKITGGSAWESNPPSRLLTRYTGFEVREVICRSIELQTSALLLFRTLKFLKYSFPVDEW